MTSNMISRIVKSLFSVMLLASLSFTSEAFFLPEPANSDDDLVVVPNDILPEQVGEFVAPLSEQQVRALLISEIQSQADVNNDRLWTRPASVIDLVKGVGDPNSVLGQGLRSTLLAAENFWPEVSSVLQKISASGSHTGFLILTGVLLLTVIIARLFEWACLAGIKRWSAHRHAAAGNGGAKEVVSSALWLFSTNLFGLVFFVVGGYVTATLLTEDGSVLAIMVMNLFGRILVIRFFCFVFKLFLFPAPQGFELIDDRVSYRAVYRCLSVFTFCYLFGTELAFVFIEQGVPAEQLTIFFLFLFGMVVNPIVFWFVWTQRYDIDRVMFGSRDRDSDPLIVKPYPYARRAAIWPLFVTCIVMLAYLNWQIQALTGDMSRQTAIEIAWWVTILFPVVDLLVSSLLIKLIGLRIFQVPGFRHRAYRVIYIIRTAVRLIMLTILLLSFLEAWGFKPLQSLSNSMGGSIVNSIVDVGVTLLLGFVIWEAILLGMENLLPEPEESDSSEIDGEGGGAAASRSETLLPLFRTILFILLSVTVIASVLYSLGVQIGPLLAGASVVGIAIGFGSQKLVQDIISGMFFLIDDAFRRGEYVEVVGLKGTIEKLSMRSMQLRHHLGAVQTIPYGEITTVKNLSRDWVTMKLELRLSYDVDIEKVRKIVKKIGQEMIQDEVTGPMMLQPLKSQGVMRVEESALIVRMKFTAKPGEQWVVRRVAYSRVRDALAAAGIEFAHREVKVRMPPEFEEAQKQIPDGNTVTESDQPQNPILPPQGGALAGAAAAVTGAIAADLAKQSKFDNSDDFDDAQ